MGRDFAPTGFEFFLRDVGRAQLCVVHFFRLWPRLFAQPSISFLEIFGRTLNAVVRKPVDLTDFVPFVVNLRENLDWHIGIFVCPYHSDVLHVV
jgi:hypothetical protein